jgi:hypothetical protein
MWQTVSYYAVLVLESVFGVFGIRLYEEPHYDVVARLADHVEVRRYAPRLAAEVTLSRGGDAARSRAFQLLFDYIAGANHSAQGSKKVAMTVPVSVRDVERVAMTSPVDVSEDSEVMRMRFFLPAKYTRDTAPLPDDERVKLVTVPEKTVAILRYSGLGSDFEKRQFDLIAELTGSRWRPVGAPYTLYYDAPFTLPFVRRNEAAIPVEQAPTTSPPR